MIELDCTRNEAGELVCLSKKRSSNQNKHCNGSLAHSAECNHKNSSETTATTTTTSTGENNRACINGCVCVCVHSNEIYLSICWEMILYTCLTRIDKHKFISIITIDMP